MPTSILEKKVPRVKKNGMQTFQKTLWSKITQNSNNRSYDSSNQTESVLPCKEGMPQAWSAEVLR